MFRFVHEERNALVSASLKLKVTNVAPQNVPFEASDAEPRPSKWFQTLNCWFITPMLRK